MSNIDWGLVWTHPALAKDTRADYLTFEIPAKKNENLKI